MSHRTPIVVALPLAAALLVALGAQVLSAQPPGFKRTLLQRGDLSMAGREAVMAQAEIPAGVAVGKHTHPGEEVAYVLEGTLVLEVEGKAPVTLKAGDVFFVPADTVHDGKNTGTGTAKVLATYIVEKGKPLATPVR